MHPQNPRTNWPQHAIILDLYLSGLSSPEIAQKLNLSTTRTYVCLRRAAQRLAYRVFYNTPFNHPTPRYVRNPMEATMGLSSSISMKATPRNFSSVATDTQ